MLWINFIIAGDQSAAKSTDEVNCFQGFTGFRPQVISHESGWRDRCNSSESFSTLKPFRMLSIGVIKHMILIRNLVQEALSTGYLTLEAEEQLRQMLAAKYDREDLKAFMTLQQAAMAGQVKQQSRELMRL
jgi:hypothetical protein